MKIYVCKYMRMLKNKKKFEYLTKRNLVRAVKKGTKGLAKKALELRGYRVIAKNGWVVKVDGTGKVIEKIKKLSHVKVISRKKL